MIHGGINENLNHMKIRNAVNWRNITDPWQEQEWYKDAISNISHNGQEISYLLNLLLFDFLNL